jgi:hypothetical protein
MRGLSYYNRIGYIFRMEVKRMRHKVDPARTPQNLSRQPKGSQRSRATRSSRRQEQAWSQPMKDRFLYALRLTRRVEAAAFHVERSVASANAARAADPFFDAQWERVVDPRLLALEDGLLDRAINGVSEPITIDGNGGERRVRYNDSLGMFLAKKLLPEIYGTQPRSPAQPRRGTSEPPEVTCHPDPQDDVEEASRLLAEFAARIELESRTAAEAEAPERPVRPEPGCPDPA